MKQHILFSFVCGFCLCATTDTSYAAVDLFANGFERLTHGQPPLNDTGFVLCGDYSYSADGHEISGHSHSNIENCIDTIDSEGDPIPRGQDGLYQTGPEGSKGLSFTKLDNNGDPLPNNASDWSCILDNHTGLIWQVKKSAGLHNVADRFSWYNIDVNFNGGAAGEQGANYSNCYGYKDGEASTYCNTDAYVKRVNQVGLCGANDWRMPSREEMRSIVDYSISDGSKIDKNYFPIEISGWYWTAWPVSVNASGSGESRAWSFDANQGYSVAYYGKSFKFGVILVR